MKIFFYVIFKLIALITEYAFLTVFFIPFFIFLLIIEGFHKHADFIADLEDSTTFYANHERRKRKTDRDNKRRHKFWDNVLYYWADHLKLFK